MGKYERNALSQIYQSVFDEKFVQGQGFELTAVVYLLKELGIEICEDYNFHLFTKMGPFSHTLWRDIISIDGTEEAFSLSNDAEDAIAKIKPIINAKTIYSPRKWAIALATAFYLKQNVVKVGTKNNSIVETMNLYNLPYLDENEKACVLIDGLFLDRGCRYCSNARTMPGLTDDNDLSYSTVGNAEKNASLMIAAGSGIPVRIEANVWDDKMERNRTIAVYKPNFCPECGRDLRNDYK